MTDPGGETLPIRPDPEHESETNLWLGRVPLGVPGEPTRLVVAGTDTRLRPQETELNGDPTRERVGQYRIKGVLGMGGMGVVYEAWDEELKRTVALKVIHQALSGDDEIFRRFQAEAQVTSQLQHPAIVPVHTMGRSEDGELYYTMRRVDGKTLTRLVEEDLASSPSGVLTLEEATSDDSSGEGAVAPWTRFRVLQAFVLVCRAMAYAHSRGVVHRDLKPDNLMVGRFGQVYIMDWGVAKILNESTLETTSLPPELPIFPDRSIEISGVAGTKVGAVLGTPAYMAPEQAGGSAGVGPRADVYSLGGILYFVLTGQAPHLGAPTEVLQKISLGLPPRRPGSVCEGVPRDLEVICMRALAYDARKRVGSADELADLVEGYLEGRPLHLVSRKRDSGFLRSYSARYYRKPSLTVDLVPVIRNPAGQIEVLLVRRTKEPYQGCWALPGSFIQLDETLEETAQRVMLDKVGPGAKGKVSQLGVWDEPGRDPRTRVVTVGFLCLLEAWDPRRAAKDRELAWWLLEQGPVLLAVDRNYEDEPELAFDHARILSEALARLEGTAPRP